MEIKNAMLAKLVKELGEEKAAKYIESHIRTVELRKKYTNSPEAKARRNSPEYKAKQVERRKKVAADLAEYRAWKESQKKATAGTAKK